MEAIKIATFKTCNLYGVIKEFMQKEGFAYLDGRRGIELTDVAAYQFDEKALSMEITSE